MRLLLFQQYNDDTDEVDWGMSTEVGDFPALRQTLVDDAMAVELEVEPNAGMANIISVEGGNPR